MAQKKIRKAVIAAAGFGTRFLPQTKAMPKEMLPLIDKPIIQYVVEELVDAGIEDVVIVTGYHKRAIEDHFDALNTDLAAQLSSDSKRPLLERTKAISELANFAYIRQKGPYGGATPILNAEHLIGDEPFIYAFADDFVMSTPGRFRQMVDLHEKHGGSFLTCIKASSDEDYDRYGFASGTELNEELIDVDTVIEKPGKAAAPSDIASVSGYIFDPIIFSYLHKQKAALRPEDGEFKFQISLQHMIDDGHKVYGFTAKDGVYYDTGNKLEYLKTVVDFGLRSEEFGEDFRAYLQSISK